MTYSVTSNDSTGMPVSSSDDGLEILKDTTKGGKVRDWSGKKLRSGLMALHYYHAGLTKKAKRMEQCADILEFKFSDNALRLFKTWFCKVRLCPMCNWRRSLKVASHNRRIVQKVNEEHKVRWVFLTLTVQNCEGSELKKTVDDMMKAWNRLVGYSRVKPILKGYFRALEITKNRDYWVKNKKGKFVLDDSGERLKNPWYGTYHPHFHVLMCVPPSYFSHGYVSVHSWKSLWKKAMRIDYDPIVDIKSVKPKKSVDIEEIASEVRHSIEKSMAEENAVLEVSKYPVKDTDVLPEERLTNDGVETVYTLDNAMAYKRLIGYGGLMKQVHKELNLDDAEDGDLINVGEDDDEVANGALEVMAYWHAGIKNYVLYKG